MSARCFSVGFPSTTYAASSRNNLIKSVHALVTMLLNFIIPIKPEDTGQWWFPTTKSALVDPILNQLKNVLDRGNPKD